jgi:hypothetical protein
MLPDTPEELLNNTFGVLVGPICGTVRSFEPSFSVQMIQPLHCRSYKPSYLQFKTGLKNGE